MEKSNNQKIGRNGTLVSIQLTDEQKGDILSYASKYGMGMSSFIRYATFKFLESHQRKLEAGIMPTDKNDRISTR